MAIAPALGPALVTLRGDRGPLVRNTRRNRMIAAAVSVMLLIAVAWAVDSVTAGGSLSVEPGGEVSRTVSVAIPQTAPVEILVLVDTTGSAQAGVEAAVARVSDALAATDATVHVGVGVIGDYPIRPFGTVDDRPLVITQPITGDAEAWAAALAALSPARVGGDPAEGQLAALGDAMASAFTDDGPAFSPGATHVVIVATDAASHEAGDVGCDERGTCADYPGPASTDVAAAAVEGGFSIVAIGDIPRGDPLRTVATVVDPPEADAADGLAEWLAPGPVEVPLIGTCDAETVAIEHDPAQLSGRPGDIVEVIQTVTADADASGSVTCSVADLEALDVVVDIDLPDAADDEQMPPPGELDGEGERAAVGDADTGDTGESDPEEADDAEEGEADGADEAGEPVAPERATLALTTTIDAGATFAFDARLGNEVLTRLTEDLETNVELTAGSLEAAGFGDEVTFEVTTEPRGELSIPDDLEPTYWVLTPGSESGDTFTYDVIDEDGVVTAEVTVTVVIADEAEGESEGAEGESEAAEGESEGAEGESDGAEGESDGAEGEVDDGVDGADEPDDGTGGGDDAEEPALEGEGSADDGADEAESAGEVSSSEPEGGDESDGAEGAAEPDDNASPDTAETSPEDINGETAESDDPGIAEDDGEPATEGAPGAGSDDGSTGEQ